MPFNLGDIYRCPDPACAAEVTVTKAAPPESANSQQPKCICGQAMEIITHSEEARHAHDAAELRELESEHELGVLTDQEFHAQADRLDE